MRKTGKIIYFILFIILLMFIYLFIIIMSLFHW